VKWSSGWLFVLAFACGEGSKEPVGGAGTGGRGAAAGVGGAAGVAVTGGGSGVGGVAGGVAGVGGGASGKGGAGGAGTGAGGNGAGMGGAGLGGSAAGIGGADAGSGGTVAGSSGSAGSAGSAGNAGTGGAGPSGVPFVYVAGTDGNITIYRLDRTAKTLTFDARVNAGNYPSFLAVNPARTTLYATIEASESVAAFAINPTTGGLTKRNEQQTGGGAPTHVAVDKTGDWVMVANYNGGSVRIFPTMDDGSLGMPSDTKMPGTNPHLIITDAANAFAFVPCKGSDLVAQYAFNAQTGVLTPNGTPSVATAAGAGPRHLAFHPNGMFAYLINELDDTMTAFSYDAGTGRLTTIHSLSTLPGGMASGSNSTAEVQVHPTGKFLYGSNRGDDSIVVYTLADDGRMTLAGHDDSGGQTPRHFSLDDTGTLLFAANRDTNNVVVFSVNPDTGRLTEASEVTGVQQPEFAALVTLPSP
jgi:6-phosphogluconolactonase